MKELIEKAIELIEAQTKRGLWSAEADETLIHKLLTVLTGQAAPFSVALLLEIARRWLLTKLSASGPARTCEMNGHLWHIRSGNEPDEVEHCVHCHESYASGSFPGTSRQCSRAPQVAVAPRRTLEEFGRETFSPEFLAASYIELQRTEIIAEGYDRCWVDGILPHWEFYRAKGGGRYIGVDEETGDTVEGQTEEAVYQAALDMELAYVETEFAGECGEE